jgi:hypothetical protein
MLFSSGNAVTMKILLNIVAVQESAATINEEAVISGLKYLLSQRLAEMPPTSSGAYWWTYMSPLFLFYP